MEDEATVTLEQVNSYQRWLEEEKIPVIRGYYVEDARKVELHPWQRTGGLGVYLDLGGAQLTGAYICEIPPGKSLNPERHMYEEIIYIVGGRGATSVWTEDTPKQSFDWQEGSLFSPPLNTWHQLSNTDPDQPARFYAVTGAHLLINMFRDYDFIFNDGAMFKDRYSGESDYFSEEGRLLDISGHPVWEGNFIKDVRSVELPMFERMGRGHKILNLALSGNTMEAHISEFEACTYKKAHSTFSGAHIIIIEGEGYSLLWQEGQPKQRVDWHKYSILAPPPIPWFHGHFITGSKDVRQVAIRWGGKRYSLFKRGSVDADIKKGGAQIEYCDEDPDIRQMFEQELAKKGLKSKMDDSLYIKV